MRGVVEEWGATRQAAAGVGWRVRIGGGYALTAEG
jgi:hypothetical protein